jgi:hypothetical protein
VEISVCIRPLLSTLVGMHLTEAPDLLCSAVTVYSGGCAHVACEQFSMTFWVSGIYQKLPRDTHAYPPPELYCVLGGQIVFLRAYISAM